MTTNDFIDAIEKEFADEALRYTEQIQRHQSKIQFFEERKNSAINIEFLAKVSKACSEIERCYTEIFDFTTIEVRPCFIQLLNKSRISFDLSFTSTELNLALGREITVEKCGIVSTSVIFYKPEDSLDPTTEEKLEVPRFSLARTKKELSNSKIIENVKETLKYSLWYGVECKDAYAQMDNLYYYLVGLDKPSKTITPLEMSDSHLKIRFKWSDEKSVDVVILKGWRVGDIWDLVDHTQTLKGDSTPIESATTEHFLNIFTKKF